MNRSNFSDDRFLTYLLELQCAGPIHKAIDSNKDFFIVSGYDEIVEILTNHELYASRFGMNLNSDPAAVEAVKGRMLSVSDMPNHNEIKKHIAGAFTQRALDALKLEIEEQIDRLFDEVVDAGKIDFVARVARKIPTRVIGVLLGIPDEDMDYIGELTTSGLSSADPVERYNANTEIFLYFDDLIRHKKRHHSNDLISYLIERQSSDKSFTDEIIVINLIGILTGGNETTRYSMAGAINEFAKPNGQWERFKLGDADMRHVREEIFRFTSPGLHNIRTVTAAHDFHGVELAPGDVVSVWVCAANRDPKVFDNANEFDITRKKNPHLSFGFGRHTCIGARLARMEMDGFLDVLQRRVNHITVEEEPIWNEDNFTRGPTQLTTILNN